MREIKVVENFIDKAVHYVDPVRGAKRLKARASTAMAQSFFKGGSRTRKQTKGWTTKPGDADQKINNELEDLRERSLSLYAGSPLATGAINTNSTSVVGPGLVLRPAIDRRVLGLSDVKADALEDDIVCNFNAWAEDSKHFDLAGTHNFYESTELADRCAMIVGDTFVNMPYRKRQGSKFGLKVQLIDGSRVCNTDRKMDTLGLSAGIEKDADGMPIAYHVLNMHPARWDGKVKRKWDRLEIFGKKSGRRNALQYFHAKHIGQSRGFPYLSPVIEQLKKLDEYTDAEITAAVINGLFTVFLKSSTGEDMPEGVATGGASVDDDELHMGSGSIVGLADGEEPVFADPKRPNANFDPFVQAIIRQIGVALELPFEFMVKHFTSSYSASRAAMLEAWRYFMARRVRLARRFCAPIYENWFEEAVSLGIIHAPGFFADPVIRRAYLGAKWKGPAKGQINEKVEIEAARDRIALGVSTSDEETAEINGGDFHNNVRQIKRENTARKESDMDIPGLKQASDPNPPAKDNDL